MKSVNQWAISVRSSITGFHSPIKHKGMTLEQFLKCYEEYAKSKRPYYYDFLVKHRGYFVGFIEETLLKNKRVL